MFRSIFQKEWLKLKFYTLISLVLVVSSLVYFGFNLNFAFSTVEPESMMWYKFIHLENKPYFYLSYLYLFTGMVIAFAQFLPEKIQKRVKITVHLPLNMNKIVWLHLLIGIFVITALSTFFSWVLLNIIAYYYPDEVVRIAFKDTIAYTFASIVLYIGTASVIIEQNKKLMFLKALFVVLFCFIFLKQKYMMEDSLWLLFLIFIPFLVLDSFCSIKEQRIGSVVYKAGFVISSLALVYLSYTSYKANYKHEFNKYYIFYSNVIDDFVYQKNFGDHRFEYGVKDKIKFERKTYESYLPFVYWRDLDIQNKLPVNIKGEEFDKKRIKSSRLGFGYNPKMLEDSEVKLYPLINPQANSGMIKFPEEFFGIFHKGAKVYNYDHGHDGIDHITDKLNSLLFDKGFVFPAKNIWGKTTNMKPFDKGYLILDNENKLYNLKREENKLYVNKIDYPKGIDLAFVKISENRQKILSGYAIDANSNFYLLGWDFRFIKVPLENFDHKKMKLKLIANPLNYLIRYDDGKSYYGAVFSKNNYKKIKTVNIR